MELIASAAFGLEGIVKKELLDMGFDARGDQGCVRFSGDMNDAFRANLWLRCADRVLIMLAEKEVRSFEDLFQLVSSVPFEEMLPRNARITVTGKCVRSTLMSVRDCQAVAKKAIVERLRKAYRTGILPESGAEYKVDIAIHGDICRITLDTSGMALNRRGYRTWNGEAPLRETLAAALVLLSPWHTQKNRDLCLHDPCCGTGTLLIEAAWIMSDRAPGLTRSFAMEEWDICDKEQMRFLRDEAKSKYNPEKISGISGSDIDPEALKLCKRHIVQAGLSNRITVYPKDLRELNLSQTDKVPCFLANPPYGERLSDKKSCEKLYRELNKLRVRHPDSRLCVITAYVGFEKCVGLRALNKRRLYNGRLECEYLIY